MTEINCSKDPIDALKQMFLNRRMGTRITAGQCPARQFVFLKPHDIAKVRLDVLPGLTTSFSTGATADFILQNFHMFFVNDRMEMCEYAYTGVVNHDYDAYPESRPDTAKVVYEMAPNLKRVVDNNYWSGLPDSSGPDNYVKYIIMPVESQDLPSVTPGNDPNYLYDKLQPEYVENLSYNPWRMTADHQPVGGINDARKVVYKASVYLRYFKNRVPDT